MKLSHLDLTPHFCDGDTVAQQQLIRILINEGCQDFVETGTYLGGTAQGVKEACPKVRVWTIESDGELFDLAYTYLVGTGVNLMFGDSVTSLWKVMSRLGPRPFFFLDAHISAWNVQHDSSLVEHYPLREEIVAIASVAHLNPIIAIHDFVSPTRPDFSFDCDHRVPLDWNYIAESIKLVYPEPIPHFYNTEAAGKKNGIVYIGVTQ